LTLNLGVETPVNLASPRFHGKTIPLRSTMEDHALRLYIRAKLENGHLLPHDGVPHVWGGPGNGETCDGCEETVTKGQLVMEGVGIKGDEVQFHVKCFYVWAAERTNLSDSHEPRDGRALIRATDISTFSPAPSHAPPPGTPVAGP
jgi:hypothetical protein